MAYIELTLQEGRTSFSIGKEQSTFLMVKTKAPCHRVARVGPQSSERPYCATQWDLKVPRGAVVSHNET